MQESVKVRWAIDLSTLSLRYSLKMLPECFMAESSHLDRANVTLGRCSYEWLCSCVCALLLCVLPVS